MQLQSLVLSLNKNIMVIEIKKFRLVSVDDKFDIYETISIEKKDKVTKRKTGEKIQKEKLIAYSMRLPDCIQYILDRTVNDLPLNVDLCQYVKIYQNEREIISNILNTKV